MAQAGIGNAWITACRHAVPSTNVSLLWQEEVLAAWCASMPTHRLSPAPCTVRRCWRFDCKAKTFLNARCRGGNKKHLRLSISTFLRQWQHLRSLRRHCGSQQGILAPCDAFDPWSRLEGDQVGIWEFVHRRWRLEIWEYKKHKRTEIWNGRKRIVRQMQPSEIW